MFTVSMTALSVQLRRAVIWGNGIRRTIRILPSAPVVLRRITCDIFFFFHWMIHHIHKISYRSWVNVLSPVRYLGLIWVVSRANHRTGGGRDAAGANGRGARLADRQPLLFQPHPVANAARTPLGVCRPRNPWPTWENWNETLCWIWSELIDV